MFLLLPQIGRVCLGQRLKDFFKLNSNKSSLYSHGETIIDNGKPWTQLIDIGTRSYHIVKL